MEQRDTVSGLTHLLGIIGSVIATTLLITTAVTKGTIWHIVSFAIFGGSLILLYSASTVYHLSNVEKHTKLWLKKIDHMMVYVLIAGSYTPFCLVPLRGWWGWSLLVGIWSIAIVGIVLKIFWIHAPRWLYTSFYLAMGWVLIVAIGPLIRTVPAGGLWWLAAGGLFYTLGAIIYATKWPRLLPGIFGFHEIWHIFVLSGSFCHVWAIYKFIILVN
ncbi:MAG: hemolysin III family protein [bacterium]|nr:hemolysin III family protein [bacterium]